MIKDELSGALEFSHVNEAYVSQPATCAIQISLVSLLSSWNIRPTAVVGHSSGEIAAAFAAGALSLDACMSLAYHRGRLAVELKKRFPDRSGGMLAIGASSRHVGELIKRVTRGTVTIACFNGPSLITASGDEDAIHDLQKLAEAENLFVRKLRVDVAYHSHHMLDIEHDYMEAVGELTTTNTTEVLFCSSLTGDSIDTHRLDAKYWAQNMTSPVRFVQAIEKMCVLGSEGVDTLVEIGPHSALEAPTRDILKATPGLTKQINYLPTLVRQKDGCLTMLQLVSKLHVRGHTPDLAAVNGHLDTMGTVLKDLPSYPWARDKRYWHESRLSQNYRFRKFPPNDLLGSLVDDSNDMEPRWRNVLRLSEVPWLSHHKVQSSTIMPLAGYLTMVIEAAYQRAILRGGKVTSSSKYLFRQVAVNRTLVIAESMEVETSVTFKPVVQGYSSSSDVWDNFNIYSRADNSGWIEHCRGLISLDLGDKEVNAIDGTDTIAARELHYGELKRAAEVACIVPVDVAKAYETLSKAGLEFGPIFRNLREARAGPGQSVGVVGVPHTGSMMPGEFESNYVVHPATLDACFHPVTMAVQGGTPVSVNLHLPTFLESLSVSHGINKAPDDEMVVYARVEEGTTARDICVSIAVFEPTEQKSDPLIEFKRFIASELESEKTKDSSRLARGLCCNMQWLPCLDLAPVPHNSGIHSQLSTTKAKFTQIQLLERAAYYYIQAAVDSLSPHDIQRFQPHHQKLYESFMDFLALGKRNKLPHQSLDWLAANEAERSTFLAEIKSLDNCGRLVCEIGANIGQILRSQIDPLSIMLKDDLLMNFYTDSDATLLLNQWSTDVVDILARQNPQIKILEIGAGTGGATYSILQALGGENGAKASFASYDFTDVSPAFFEKAKDRFVSWGHRIRYSKLDIENDPGPQGFQPGTYDVVIAANVLHATARIDHSLANVRRLLKPGGKLLLMEITNRRLCFTLVFGTLQGNFWLQHNLRSWLT